MERRCVDKLIFFAESNQTSPSTTIFPDSGTVSPASMRNTVVLPTPDGPNNAEKLPCTKLACIDKSMRPVLPCKVFLRSISINSVYPLPVIVTDTFIYTRRLMASPAPVHHMDDQ